MRHNAEKESVGDRGGVKIAMLHFIIHRLTIQANYL